MANKFPLGNQFQRLGRFPLDETAFYEDYESALDYASNNKSAYIGQHIFVKDARTEKEKQDVGIKPYSEFYFVNSDYELEPACFFSRELLVLLTFLLENAEYKTDMSENLEDFRHLLNLGNATVTGPEPPPLGNCEITIYMLPTYNTVGDSVDDYVTLVDSNGATSTTATLSSLGEVKVTNSNISSLFTETYRDNNTYDDIDLIGRILNKYFIEDTSGNSVTFSGKNADSKNNYLFIEFGPCHFSSLNLSYNSNIKRIKFKKGFTIDSLVKGAFFYCGNVEYIDGLKYIDTSQFTSLDSLFSGNESLKEIDLSTWDTTLVETTENLFYNCFALTTIGDVGNWVTINVKNMSRMFSGCRALKSLNCSNWNTKRVENMYDMFYNCGNLNDIDVSSWDVSNVTDMSRMFFATKYKDLARQIEQWRPKALTTTAAMLKATPIESIDLSGWAEENDEYSWQFAPADVSSMFCDCEELKTINLSNWKFSGCSMDCMFQNCKKLTDLNMTGWNKVGGSKSYMFSNCSSLTDVSAFTELYSNDYNFNTTDISKIFTNTAITSIDWSNVTVTAPVEAYDMFRGCNDLETITMKNWKIDSWSYSNNPYYKNKLFIYETAWGEHNYNIGIFNLPKLKTVDMSGWYGQAGLCFDQCTVLESVDLSCDEYNQGQRLEILNSTEMFSGCELLTTVNLKNVDLGYRLDGMFSGCTNLTSIIFDGATAEDVNYGSEVSKTNMFYNCLQLQRENISTVGCSDEFIAIIDEAFNNRYTYEY